MRESGEGSCRKIPPAPATGPLVVAINAGSSSLKIAAFARGPGGDPQEVLRVLFDHHHPDAVVMHGDPAIVAALPPPAAHDAPDFACGLAARLPVRAVVHRVVHGGDETRECVALDPAYRERLHALAPLAPLHQPPALAIIDAITAACPALPQYACLDTAFHAAMPAAAREFALPADVRERHPELHAYGFHGLSCRSATQALQRTGTLPERLVIAHLGSGASVTAVQDGHSIATSMGFSALDGLPMATRPGRLDPGAVLYLLRAYGGDTGVVENMLYRQAGLLGLSGLSGDMRVLLASDAPRAKAAVDCFVYRAAQEIAALAVALGGIDTLAFTGGIGEHQPTIRTAIVARLGILARTPRVVVVACDEEAVMAAAVPSTD